MSRLELLGIKSTARSSAKISPSRNAPIIPAACFKRLAYCGAMLTVALGMLTAAEPFRRAEPFIGRQIADMFVFSILRNNPERLVPTFVADQVPNRVRLDDAGQL